MHAHARTIHNTRASHQSHIRKNDEPPRRHSILLHTHSVSHSERSHILCVHTHLAAESDLARLLEHVEHHQHQRPHLRHVGRRRATLPGNCNGSRASRWTCRRPSPDGPRRNPWPRPPAASTPGLTTRPAVHSDRPTDPLPCPQTDAPPDIGPAVAHPQLCEIHCHASVTFATFKTIMSHKHEIQTSTHH